MVPCAGLAMRGLLLVAPTFVAVGTALVLALPPAATELANAAPGDRPVECLRWNLDGSYVFDFEYFGGHYLHDATISGQKHGAYDIAGGFPAGGPHENEWSGRGFVNGNSVTNSVVFRLGAPGTHMGMSGTVAADGSMSGTWTDDYQGARSGTWTTASGTATCTRFGPARECDAWNLDGAYVVDFEYLGGHYFHDATISGQRHGAYEIAGGFPAGGAYAYEWSGEGSITHNALRNRVEYRVGARGTHMKMAGTVAADGSMSGTWSDDYQGERRGTWTTAAGKATCTHYRIRGR